MLEKADMVLMFPPKEKFSGKTVVKQRIKTAKKTIPAVIYPDRPLFMEAK